MDEDHLVAFAVAEEVVHRLARAAERDLDIVVPDEHASAADLVALRGNAAGLEVPVSVLGGEPLLALGRHERSQLLHATRRMQVVEDRLVTAEPLEAHHLLGQERPVVAELHVPLARNRAKSLVERHR